MPTWCYWKTPGPGNKLLDHIDDLCAFNGDMDKVAGYLCTKDICNEADKILKGGPPPIATSLHARELKPCQGRRGCRQQAPIGNYKRNNVKLLAIYETWKTRVKAWIENTEKTGTAEPKAGKKGSRLHNPWASRDNKIKELETVNKRLKAKVNELKGSGGAVSTSTVGAHDEEASIQLEQEGKKWKGEFERLAQEKQEATPGQPQSWGTFAQGFRRNLSIKNAPSIRNPQKT